MNSKIRRTYLPDETGKDSDGDSGKVNENELCSILYSQGCVPDNTDPERSELISLEINRLFNEVDACFFCRDIQNDNYIYLSAGCEKIYGYPLHDFHRNTQLWYDVIHSDDKHIVLSDDKLLSKGTQVLSEYRIIHRDGGIRWIEMKIVPVIIDGKLCRVEGIINDITERKKEAEEKERITADLLQRNSDLRQLSYIISHDLRSPISKILGLVSLLADMSSSEHYKKELIGYLEAEAVNLDNVVKDLNILLSSSEKGITANKDEIDFQAEFTKITRSLQSEIIESGAAVSADFSAAGCITSIRSFIDSMLFNLLSNAIKYRSPERPSVIQVRTSSGEGFICLSVSDNGLGIDLEQYGDKIFGLYNRFHTKVADGKGLGLNLVKTQAETLGGRVEVESKAGHGATFRVFLPV